MIETGVVAPYPDDRRVEVDPQPPDGVERRQEERRRRGRPPSDDPRIHRLRIRLNQHEMIAILMYAHANHQTIAELGRDKLLEEVHDYLASLTPPELSALRALAWTKFLALHPGPGGSAELDPVQALVDTPAPGRGPR